MPSMIGMQDAIDATIGPGLALLVDRRLEALGRPLAADDLEPFTQERYDVLLSPTLGEPPLEIGVLTLQDPGAVERIAPRFSPFTMFFNVTGQPSMSVPLHWNEEGLPIGTLWTGRYGDEATLLRLAAQLEQARPWWDRRPPI
jgi:Asp-tRNA(Asn)/Glu-tRNA(Gln) amidotransferase A subunit family amidase